MAGIGSQAQSFSRPEKSKGCPPAATAEDRLDCNRLGKDPDGNSNARYTESRELRIEIRLPQAGTELF
jgi:hypothetical protein